MKIKSPEHKRKIVNRLRRIEGQIRGVVQMVEDDSPIQKISQQLSAIRSAVTNTMYEEFFCVLEKVLEKRSSDIPEKDIEELKSILKGIK